MISRYPDELPCDSEPHGDLPDWFRYDEPMDDREVLASDWLSLAADRPDLRNTRPARPTPALQLARRPGELRIGHIIAGIIIGAGIVILIALALLPESFGGKRPDVPPPSRPVALTQERWA